MAPVRTTATPTAADFDVIQNRVAVALAKRERLIKSWTASSARSRPPPKTQEELDAEDADLFNPAPAGLGLGAPIPKEFLEGDVKRKEIATNGKLRQLILGNRAGLQASKPRDGREKAGGAKRGLQEESSDEDQGRSALGKAKKHKNGTAFYPTNKSFKDGARTEVKQEGKSSAQENLILESSHVFSSEVKPQVKTNMRIEISQENSSLQRAKIQAAGKKKPLVDYGSDDESDYHGIEPISAVSQKERSKSGDQIISSSSTKVAINVRPNSADDNGTEATTKSRSTMPSPADVTSSKHNITELQELLSPDAIAAPKKPSSKSSSSHSSKSCASSTESEPSDMETAIPLSLTSDVNGRTLLPVTDRSLSAIEAKRDRNRKKRAKQREKDQRRKALALSIASSGAEKPLAPSTEAEEKGAIASSGGAEKMVNAPVGGAGKSASTPMNGVGVAKKIKDRLLDANGN